MKHLSVDEVACEATGRAPTRRALAKQQTRAKVLAAARRLFSEGGYEGATIRDIAAAAGMSTGAVFANFTDKADLFGEIMSADMAQLLHVMREAAANAQRIEDQIVRVMMAGYDFYGSRLPLARAGFAVAWGPEGWTIRHLPASVALRGIFVELMDAAVERGELRQDAEVNLCADMIFESYLCNFARLIYEAWSLEMVEVRCNDQVRTILAGNRK